jgi:hypothetical protein
MDLLPTISLRPQNPSTLNRRAHQREPGQGEIAVNVHLVVETVIPVRIPKALRGDMSSMNSTHPSLALLHRAGTVFRMQPRNPVLTGAVDVGRQSVDGAVFRRPPLISKAVAEIDRHSRDLGDLRHVDRSRFRKRRGFRFRPGTSPPMPVIPVLASVPERFRPSLPQCEPNKATRAFAGG